MSALHLLHTLPDPRRLAAWAAQRDFMQEDPGYAMHALLHAAFGEQAPQPFRYLDAGKGLLAYTRMTPDELRGHVALADPEVVAALGLGATAEHSGCSLRVFPDVWPAGHRFGFELRVRPVVRESATRSERDAYLVAVEACGGTPLDRGEIYHRWLSEQLNPTRDFPTEPWQGAIELVDAKMIRFRLLEVVRRTQAERADPQRKRHTVSGPDVVFTGRLRVIDPQAFSKLIARGVGRHRAFGFGMLMLRSAA